jgi:hypothetical protein
MRAAWIVFLLVALTLRAEAQDSRAAAPQQRHGKVRTDLFIDVPLDRYSTDVVFPFGGAHHGVPGVVAVNHAPYYCTRHARAFRERAGFVAHLRTRHGLKDADIPAAVLVDGGQVRYIGD